MKAYKIFRVISTADKAEELRSLTRSDFTMTYAKRKVNRPKVGKFFVFRSRAAALEFLHNDWTGTIVDRQLWRVEVDSLKPLPKCAQFVSAIEAFWKSDKILYSIVPPNGTFVCNTVKLVERIK